jgi:hemolysin D
MRRSIASRQASMKSAEKIVNFPTERVSSRKGDEIAFLPAALEIVETPPSPIGRTIGMTIVAVFAVAVAWACVGKVDIVATAPGKIIPSGRTKVVQPLESGVVRAIHVQDGQSVKTGDLLVELDPTISGADVAHLKGDLLSAQLDVARLRAAIAGHDDPLADFNPPTGAPPELVRMYRQLLISQTAEQNSKLSGIDREIAQKEAEHATVDATKKKLDATIPLLQERVDVRKQLYEKELGSRLLYLTELQDLVSQQQDLLVQQSRSREVDAAIAALVEARKKSAAEYQRALYDDLTKAEQKAAGLRQDLVKADQKAKQQDLTAPVDGVVQQLAVHTIGGVATSAQPLMVIVPLESHIVIEAMISNRDIGFIKPGQEAAIKIDTFNFTRYGLLHGNVLNVSHDAITREAPPDKTANNSQSSELTSSEPKGQELLYMARVSLDRTNMQIDDKLVDLSPGMAVTVEIKTGSRRIISYLLSPLTKYSQDSLHER